MNRRSLEVTLALAIAMTCAFTGHAQKLPDWFENIDAKVMRGTSVTYADLIRKMFPDAKRDDTFSTDMSVESTPSLGHLNPSWEKPNTKRLIYRGKMSVHYEDVLLRRSVTKGGSDYLIALFFVNSDVTGDNSTISETETVIEKTPEQMSRIAALFRIGPKTEFLDAVDVGTDLGTEIEKTSLADHFWVINGHENCCTHSRRYTLMSD